MGQVQCTGEVQCTGDVDVHSSNCELLDRANAAPKKTGARAKLAATPSFAAAATEAATASVGAGGQGLHPHCARALGGSPSGGLSASSRGCVALATASSGVWGGCHVWAKGFPRKKVCEMLTQRGAEKLTHGKPIRVREQNPGN